MKRALLSGASSGIGLALARALLADGWSVVTVSRTPPPIRHGEYRQYAWIPHDVAEPIDPLLFDDDETPLDALVHCAGSQAPIGAIANTDPVAWTQSIQVNLLGAYHVVKAALPALTRSTDARILLFSGGGAFSPRPRFSAYAAAKAGVVALMEALAQEVPPHVTANCVAPGFVVTPIHEPTRAAGLEIAGAREYGFSIRADQGELSEVVACVRHLLSPDAKGLTGKTVAVGWDPWRSIDQTTVPFFNGSDIWTRTRVKAQDTPCPSQGAISYASAD